MWLTHFWHSWSQFFIFAWDVTAGGILRTGVLIFSSFSLKIKIVFIVFIVKIVYSSWKLYCEGFWHISQGQWHNQWCFLNSTRNDFPTFPTRFLGEYCPKLRALQVRECREITEASLARLRFLGIKIDVPPHSWTYAYLRKINLQIWGWLYRLGPRGGAS